MNKNNKKILIAFIVVVIIAAVLLFALLNNSKENHNKETTEIIEHPAVPDDVVTITFAVPDICSLDEKKLSLFNDELLKDGLKYRLDVKYLEFENYTELLENEAKNGSIDVAFMGLGDVRGANNTYDLIRSGLFYNLDDILLSDTGKNLYNSFPENLWESVKCDKHIYSIPSTVVDDRGIYCAFNTDYVKEEEIEKWDGNIGGLYDILKRLTFEGEDTYAFQYLVTDYLFEKMIDCEIRSGLLYDYDTQTVENPLESDKFIGFLRTIDEMKNNGYLKTSVSFLNNSGLNDAGVRKDIEAGNYAIALCSGNTDKIFLKDNVCVKRLPEVLSSRINGSIGIVNNADINSVVDFLSKLYNSEKYGNILLYGLENENYKVVDGIACDSTGAALYDNFMTKLGLNLFINLLPVSGEDFMVNRREEYFAFYESIHLSPFIGFEPDTEHLGNISTDLDSFMTSLNRKSVDEALPIAEKKLQSDGMDEYLESVRNQWEEYK